MVLFLLGVLICSSLAMVLLLYMKHWELSTGQVLLGTTRPHLTSFFHRLILVVEHHLPNLIQKWIERGKVLTRYGARAALAHALLALETWLEQTLHGVRSATSQSQGEASTFLQEVGDYKKRLRFRNRKKTDL